MLHVCGIVDEGNPVPLALTGADAPFASVVASEVLMGREALAVVWYMELRSSREAGVADAVGILDRFILPVAGFGLLPGCMD